MAHEDTARLLRECNAGIKMGLDSIETVLPRCEDRALAGILRHSIDEHKRLQAEAKSLLDGCHEPDREPSGIVKSMAHMKSGMKLFFMPGRASTALYMSNNGRGSALRLGQMRGWMQLGRLHLPHNSWSRPFMAYMLALGPPRSLRYPLKSGI